MPIARAIALRKRAESSTKIGTKFEKKTDCSCTQSLVRNILCVIAEESGVCAISHLQDYLLFFISVHVAHEHTMTQHR